LTVIVQSDDTRLISEPFQLQLKSIMTEAQISGNPVSKTELIEEEIDAVFQNLIHCGSE